MLKLKQKSASQQARERFAAIGRRKLKIHRMTKGEPVIPAHVLKKLAALNLPPNKWVYSVCLEALLRNSSSSLEADSVAPAMTSAASAMARRSESQRRYETQTAEQYFSEVE
jgi:hypothetical protein